MFVFIWYFEDLDAFLFGPWHRAGGLFVILGDTGGFIICVSFLRIVGFGMHGACSWLNVRT